MPWTLFAHTQRPQVPYESLSVMNTERLTAMPSNSPVRARAETTLSFQPDAEMPVIAFAGDWHEGPSGIYDQFRSLSNLGVHHLHHVGTLSLRPDHPGRTSLDQLNDLACQFELWITVTPGTRADWRHLATAFEAAGAGNPAPVRSRIEALPRGCRWREGGRTFLSHGGTSAFESEEQELDSAWWQDEVAASDEFDALIADGHADIMVTNDSPVPGTLAVNQIRPNPSRRDLDAYVHAAYDSQGITAAWVEASPDILIHGHYNLRDEITLPGGQRIHSLASSGNAGNVMLLDLRTLKSTWLEDTRP